LVILFRWISLGREITEILIEWGLFQSLNSEIGELDLKRETQFLSKKRYGILYREICTAPSINGDRIGIIVWRDVNTLRARLLLCISS
jgi:hypothetical protein